MTPPSTHTPSITHGSGSSRAIPTGVRKMPEPMVIPTTSPTELHKPRVLGRRPVVVVGTLRRLSLRPLLPAAEHGPIWRRAAQHQKVMSTVLDDAEACENRTLVSENALPANIPLLIDFVS